MSEAGRARAALVGTPTKKPHYERTNRYNELVRARESARWRRLTLAEGIASTPPALFALRDFDLQEQRRLKEWLRANWRLFLLRKIDSRGSDP